MNDNNAKWYIYILCTCINIYIYLFYIFIHVADAFIQSDLLHVIHFLSAVGFLGIEPLTFCAANTMLYHWATV